MANAGVPEAIWVSTIASENPGAVTNPASINTPVSDPPGFSYGLFQFHNQPAMVDPVASGNQAASIMGKALQSLPSNASPSQQLTAIEYAAWPGNDSALVAKENPQRLANLQSIIAQEQDSPLASIYQSSEPSTNQFSQLGILSPFGGPVAAGQATQTAVTSAGNNIQSAVTSGIAGVQSAVASGAIKAGQVALALAVVAGGFALLASSGGSDESSPTPARA